MVKLCRGVRFIVHLILYNKVVSQAWIKYLLKLKEDLYMNGISLATKRNDADQYKNGYEREAGAYEEKKLSLFSMIAVSGSFVINLAIVAYALISSLIA